MRIAFIYIGEPDSFCPPLGILTIGTILHKQGHKVKILDDTHFAERTELIDNIKQFDPELIGISSSSISFGRVESLLPSLRASFPKIPFVLGGPHGTALTQETLDANPEFDVICVGEGEEVFQDLIKYYQEGGNLSEIRGIAFRDRDEIVFTERQDVVDLKKLPIPDRRLLDNDKYMFYPGDVPCRYPCATISCSRGCYGNCFYCQPLLRNTFGRKVRHREPDQIVDELKLLELHGARSVYFVDDEPGWKHKDWLIELCSKIREAEINLTFCVTSRVDQITEETALALKAAGCVCVMFGVESGSERILKVMRKGTSIAQARRALEICRKHKIISRIQLMVGTPEETVDSLQKTVDLAEELKPDLIGMSITTPTPGSDLYKVCRQNGISNITRWEDYDRTVSEPIKLKSVSSFDLSGAIKKVYKTYYRELILSVINPVKFIQRWYFFREIAIRYLTMLANPRVLICDIKYYLRYSDKVGSRQAK